MDFKPNGEQLAMQRMAREYVMAEIIPNASRWDEQEEAPEGQIRKMTREGFSTITVPREYGGRGMDEITLCLVTEELGRGCAGLATAVGANTLAATPILLAGNDEQKSRYLPAIASGKLASYCLTEPGAGSDVSAITTLARRDSDGSYLLNGVKCFITNGGCADLYVVFAITNPKRGVRTLTPFIVERGTPGLSPGKKERKMGIRASDTSEVIFDQVRIPEENRLGREGGGFRTAMETFDRTRPMIGALSVGVARAALETAVRFAKERVQYGQSIARHEAVQLMLADMAMEIEAARTLVWRAAFLVEQGAKKVSAYSAMAKAFACDVAVRATINAVQILGGRGYTREYPVEKYMRDAKIMQIYEGTNEIQRLIIADGIMKGYLLEEEARLTKGIETG